MAHSFNTIAIVGVGLIGGSFGLALREAGFQGALLGVSSPGALDAGLKAGAISQTATLKEAASTADLIYLAQPVDRILQTIEALGPLLQPDCVVTDAGSTKTAIVERANAYLPAGSFIGGHPLAGKETRGVESADGALFRGRPYVLTTPEDESPLSQALGTLVHRIGARRVYMTAEAHDATVALTSHLPQLLSTALAKTLAGQSNELVYQIFGTGLLDMTRLALSSSELWKSILSTNKTEVTKALDLFDASLRDLRQALENDGLVKVFSTAEKYASTIRNLDSSS